MGSLSTGSGASSSTVQKSLWHFPFYGTCRHCGGLLAQWLPQDVWFFLRHWRCSPWVHRILHPDFEQLIDFNVFFVADVDFDSNFPIFRIAGDKLCVLRPYDRTTGMHSERNHAGICVSTNIFILVQRECMTVESRDVTITYFNLEDLAIKPKIDLMMLPTYHVQCASCSVPL